MSKDFLPRELSGSKCEKNGDGVGEGCLGLWSACLGFRWEKGSTGGALAVQA